MEKMERLESVQRAVRAWRSVRPRGRLPAALRERVIRVSGGMSDDELRRAFGVRARTVALWKAGGRAKDASPGFAVLEVAAPSDPARAADSRELRVDVRTRCGARICITGALSRDDLVALLGGGVG